MSFEVGSEDPCSICLDEFYKSHGSYINAITLHATLEATSAHRIHFDCMIGLFKSAIATGIELCCPLCRDPVKMDVMAEIAQYTLMRGRACEATPGATVCECPFLLRGFVSDIDTEFAKKIITEQAKGDAGKRSLANAIVTYWQAH